MASSSQVNRITFTEVDEVNNPTATYIYSEASPPPKTLSTKGVADTGRIDVTVIRSPFPTPVLSCLATFQSLTK